MNLAYNPLLPQSRDKLNDWLSKPEFDILKDVLKDRVFVLQAECANESFDAVCKGQDVKVVERAVSKLQDAAAIEKALNILTAIKDGKFSLQTSTATPTP